MYIVGILYTLIISAAIIEDFISEVLSDQRLDTAHKLYRESNPSSIDIIS